MYLVFDLLLSNYAHFVCAIARALALFVYKCSRIEVCSIARPTVLSICCMHRKWHNNECSMSGSMFSLVIKGFLGGISGRPSSMYMLCPHEIGRDIWDRGGQESVEIFNSPEDLGEEVLTERTRSRV